MSSCTSTQFSMTLLVWIFMVPLVFSRGICNNCEISLCTIIICLCIKIITRKLDLVTYWLDWLYSFCLLFVQHSNQYSLWKVCLCFSKAWHHCLFTKTEQHGLVVMSFFWLPNISWICEFVMNIPGSMADGYYLFCKRNISIHSE